MRVIIETSTFTGTGDGTTSVMGNASPGQPGSGIAHPNRIVHVSGIAGGSVVKLEGSLNNSDWFDWVTTIDANKGIVIEAGPLYLKPSCTTYGSGTVKVIIQKFVEN